MTDIGSLDKRVNSQGYQVYINTVDDEYIFMQNASMSISHSEFREPTTSGINVYYSGLPDNVISGTLLFTTDFGNSHSDSAALEDLLAATNGGEYPIKPIYVKLIDNQGTSKTTTFYYSQAKLASCTIYKGQEGAVKADVTFVLFGNPAISVANTP